MNTISDSFLRWMRSFNYKSISFFVLTFLFVGTPIGLSSAAICRKLVLSKWRERQDWVIANVWSPIYSLSPDLPHPFSHMKVGFCFTPSSLSYSPCS